MVPGYVCAKANVKITPSQTSTVSGQVISSTKPDPESKIIILVLEYSGKEPLEVKTLEETSLIACHTAVVVPEHTDTQFGYCSQQPCFVQQYTQRPHFQ